MWYKQRYLFSTYIAWRNDVLIMDVWDKRLHKKSMYQTLKQRNSNFKKRFQNSKFTLNTYTVNRNASNFGDWGNPQCIPLPTKNLFDTLFEVTQWPRMYMYITSSDKWNHQKSGHSSCLEQTINSCHWERSLVAGDILISRLLLCFNAWYICSQHPFGLPLTVNGMFRTQSDYINLDLLSLKLR